LPRVVAPQRCRAIGLGFLLDRLGEDAPRLFLPHLDPFATQAEFLVHGAPQGLCHDPTLDAEVIDVLFASSSIDQAE
jgi:hypothetical protein